MLRVFGAIRLGSIKHIDELLNLGCADRQPQNLISFLEPLLEDELVISNLTAEEICELRRQMPKIMEICSRLKEFSIPSTLVHGDLHFGNVARSNGNLIFYDWTDACIAHPFMDMLPIFNESDLVLQISCVTHI